MTDPESEGLDPVNILPLKIQFPSEDSEVFPEGPNKDLTDKVILDLDTLAAHSDEIFPIAQLPDRDVPEGTNIYQILEDWINSLEVSELASTRGIILLYPGSPHLAGIRHRFPNQKVRIDPKDIPDIAAAVRNFYSEEIDKPFQLRHLLMVDTHHTDRIQAETSDAVSQITARYIALTDAEKSDFNNVLEMHPLVFQLRQLFASLLSQVRLPWG